MTASLYGKVYSTKKLALIRSDFLLLMEYFKKLNLGQTAANYKLNI